LSNVERLVKEWTSLDDAEQLRREVKKWVEEAFREWKLKI